MLPNFSSSGTTFDVPEVHPDKCPFCNMTKITEWYYEGVGFKIVKCVTCGHPMIVYNAHTPTPDKVIMCKAYIACAELFGPNFRIDLSMGQHPGHAHAHVLPPKVDTKAVSSIRRRDRGDIVTIKRRDGKKISWRRY